MKQSIYAALALVFILCAAPAMGFETPLAGDEGKLVEKIGTNYVVVSARFGCPDLAWGNLTSGGKIVVLEYVPPGDAVGSWTRMVTIMLFQLPGTPEENKPLLQKISGGLLAQYSNPETGVKLLETQNYMSEAGEPMLFLNYEIGEGPQKEHNIGALLHPAPSGKTVAFVQVQSRGGKDIGADDIETLKQLIGG